MFQSESASGDIGKSWCWNKRERKSAADTWISRYALENFSRDYYVRLLSGRLVGCILVEERSPEGDG